MDKKEYEQKMEKRLHDMDVEIGRMNAKADAAGADVRAGYQKEIRYLRERRQALKAKLNELRSSGTDAWQDIKLGTEQAWNDLSRAVKSAWSKFR
ncbi:MAG: hypothetical protein BWZ01_01379 [Deltaproteobacteria bacterium ADurb.BinA179]|jgi:cell division protein FtsB|nr:coiled coil domain-containing protein [Pseudomonadota bacterium]OPZ28028.1 MAG: hypothetical protein BWZ01_01379 [Deltaproteobacteria bacterium ADurb.BinA179]HNR50166.1 coiled coil domain-containing protein [Deltaproteobacteria bacterium]HRR69704.1 coiled coil domain-containing protein [Desulfomonilia bacterium]HOD69671.1 coiled coil domain-containing protein [Deltaproteobacteria bacterium]